MSWSSGYLENQRGKARTAFDKETGALGVAKARNGHIVEKARKIFDRGAVAKSQATGAFRRHRRKWVLAEYRKLQGKARGAKPQLKPNWAISANQMMEQAETNVLNRHKKRIRNIDSVTRREIARVRRENAPSRSRKR